ncbi:hypothetical protein MKZ38_004262 [Zalerion maritima]|uniref:Uncharacterized protein n=1 Tax=Zalerion maritima TaxID=339359 RepID=A0AAD5RY09_9PEZI|nr:hypothetical protein MKZ38_004262 [Zalerion maritima]
MRLWVRRRAWEHHVDGNELLYQLTLGNLWAVVWGQDGKGKDTTTTTTTSYSTRSDASSFVSYPTIVTASPTRITSSPMAESPSPANSDPEPSNSPYNTVIETISITTTSPIPPPSSPSSSTVLSTVLSTVSESRKLDGASNTSSSSSQSPSHSTTPNNSTNNEPPGQIDSKTKLILSLLGAIIVPFLVFLLARILWEYLYRSRREYRSLRHGAFAGQGSMNEPGANFRVCRHVTEGPTIAESRDEHRVGDTSSTMPHDDSSPPSSALGRGKGKAISRGRGTRLRGINGTTDPRRGSRTDMNVAGAGSRGGHRSNLSTAGPSRRGIRGGSQAAQSRSRIPGLQDHSTRYGSPSAHAGISQTTVNAQRDRRASKEFAAGGYGIGGYRGERTPPPKRVGSIPAETRDGAHLHPGHGFEPGE